MRAKGIPRLSGLGCVMGGAGLVTLFVSRGGCLGEYCDSRPLPGTGPETPWGLVTVVCLVAAGVGLFVSAERRIPVHSASVGAAVCAATGAISAIAAGITASRTGGETWLMPVFVFPALLLLTASGVVAGVVALQAELLPRRIATAWIVAVSLLPLFQQQGLAYFIPALQGLVCVAVGLHLLVRGGQPGRLVDRSHLGAACTRSGRLHQGRTDTGK